MERNISNTTKKAPINLNNLNMKSSPIYAENTC